MKKLVKDLGLPVEKIHACKNGCMLYWKDDVDLEYCKFCGDSRYKSARGRDPYRKKSPYAVLSGGSMCHPSNAKAWKHFDRMYLDFAEESRNVRLGLCTDGFAPHASDRCVLGNIDRRVAAVVACGCENVRSCRRSGFHDAGSIDVDCNDLPAYGMAFGWSTAGVMGCPVCMDGTRAFHLQHGRKAC
ncbi:UNVERIFIED_CONTAM: hypothetical protein Scaly_1004900 [Sesamum calycinum]|uniref:Uncharacterized protein n=1 Tax=Sesamum calycinum TaxID=2727403 RepID=A0AAW2R0I8_9LAMI